MVDRRAVIRRMECQACGTIEPAAFAHLAPGAVGSRTMCHGPVVGVEYVRADLHRGAVDDAMVERLRDSLWSTWGEGRQTTDWPTRDELRKALVAALGGQ